MMIPAGTRNPNIKISLTAIILAVIKQVTKTDAITTNQNDTFKLLNSFSLHKILVNVLWQIANRIFYPNFSKSIETQQTTIACATCQGSTFIATPRKFIRHTQLHSLSNNVGFVHVQERSMQMKSSSVLYCGFCC